MDINQVATSIPQTTSNGMPIPLSVRQQLLANALLGEQAASTAPIYSKGVGFAKLGAGLFSGIMERKQLADLEAGQTAARAQAYSIPSGASAAPPAMASGGSPAPQAAPSSVAPQAGLSTPSQGQPANGLQFYNGFLARGFNPAQAAALTGNIQQESTFNPNAYNQKEGATGILQWRQDRAQALQQFAASQGKPANDPNVQMDFVKHEMQGSEAKNAAPFMASNDVASANAALKGYIRYGDNSQGKRLNNALAYGGQNPNAPAQTASNSDFTGAPTPGNQGFLIPGASPSDANLAGPIGSPSGPLPVSPIGDVGNAPQAIATPPNPQAMAAQMQPVSDAIGGALAAQGALPTAGGNGAALGPGDWGSPSPIPNAAPNSIPNASPSQLPIQQATGPQGPLAGDFGQMGSQSPGDNTLPIPPVDAPQGPLAGDFGTMGASGPPAPSLPAKQALLAAALAQQSPDATMPQLGPGVGGQGAPLGPGDLGGAPPVRPPMPPVAAPSPVASGSSPPSSPDSAMPSLGPGVGGQGAPLGPGDLGSSVPIAPAPVPNAALAAALAQYKSPMPWPPAGPTGPTPPPPSTAIASDQPQGNVAPNIPTPPVRPANLGAPTVAANAPAPGATNAGPSVIPQPVPPPGSPPPQLLAAALAQPTPTMTGRTNNSVQTPTQFNLSQAPNSGLLAAALSVKPMPAPSPVGMAPPAPAGQGGGFNPLSFLGLGGGSPQAPAAPMGGISPSAPAPLMAGPSSQTSQTPAAPSPPANARAPAQGGYNPYGSVPPQNIAQFQQVVQNRYASPEIIAQAKAMLIDPYMPRAIPDNSVMYNPAGAPGQQFTTMPIPHKYDASRNGIIYDQSTGQVANGGQNGAPLNKVMSADEVKAAGLNPGSYQRNTITNEIAPIASPAGNDPNTYSEPMVKAIGEYHASLAAGVPQAQANVRSYNAMQGALQRIQAAGGTTGFGAEELKDLKGAINTGANLIGISPPNDISNHEEMASFGRTLAGGIAKSVGGSRVTNFEMKNFLEANPGLDLSATGNQRLIGIGAQIEQRKADIGGKILDMTTQAMQNGQRPNAGQVQDMIKSYDADPTNHIRDPISGQDLTQNYKLPDQAAPSGAQPPPSAASPAPAQPNASPQKVPMPVMDAIPQLRANPTPQMRQHFDDAYGAGASAKVLGQ